MISFIQALFCRKIVNKTREYKIINPKSKHFNLLEKRRIPLQLKGSQVIPMLKKGKDTHHIAIATDQAAS